MATARMHHGDSLFPNNDAVSLQFPTNYQQILARIHQIDPVKYSKTRNFINGAVTYLSPYIARGVVSLPQISEVVLRTYKFYQAEKLIQELAWREYFQRVWQSIGKQVLNDVKQQQQRYKHYKIPTAVLAANTGIEGIDLGIEDLYRTGYMHNHVRMYTAMLTCNIAQSHWLLPAQWMYYHLLDGDIASNMLSWQWVAGSFSSKKYFANQENISKYTGSKQVKSYLNNSYEQLAESDVPEALHATTTPVLQTHLPQGDTLSLQAQLPVAIYNTYNLDPLWHANDDCNRVLLLEPQHFEQFPISEKVLMWILQLAHDNIKNLQVFVGSYQALQTEVTKQQAGAIWYKEHPTTQHYQGVQESRAWLFPEVQGYFNSFFSYWKKCERFIR
jgi:deoxyribodipyrimidine photo-lyase